VTYGVDTSFLVQLEVIEQPGHAQAHTLKDRLIRESANLALAPQTLCEFIHIVTDPKRFERPLSIEQAVQRSISWWHLAEVRNIAPGALAVRHFHDWMTSHRLGRKRLLDTMLAATFDEHGIHRIISSDHEGFSTFGLFSITDPLAL
jgi:predicted nucleic acid-binding protein